MATPRCLADAHAHNSVTKFTNKVEARPGEARTIPQLSTNVDCFWGDTPHNSVTELNTKVVCCRGVAPHNFATEFTNKNASLAEIVLKIFGPW